MDFPECSDCLHQCLHFNILISIFIIVLRDPRVLWDFDKYKIRYETIFYSKQKARNRREALITLEEKIKECTIKCDESPSSENINNLEILQTEYDRQYEYIAQGAIIRSRANWYEHGEKSNKYFLNLENSKQKKGCITVGSW